MMVFESWFVGVFFEVYVNFFQKINFLGHIFWAIFGVNGVVGIMGILRY